MRMPTGVIGILAALISFFAVGIPLYNRGVRLPLCFLAQVGMMALLILIWLSITERRIYKVVEDKLYVRHGLLGKWVEVECHLKRDHSEEIK